MSGNSFGKIFKITSYGESHGESVGVIIDGCPPNIKIDMDFLTSELARRKPGQSKITTMRKEDDLPQIESGIFEGKTTGTPILIKVKNSNQISKDYSNIKDIFRPGHADYGYYKKYQIRDYRGGGRSSGRETIARVAAGAIAKQILASKNIEIKAWVSQIGDIKASSFDKDFIDKNSVRTCDKDTAKKMEELILNVKKEQDSIGGIIDCKITGVPVGIGEPAFDKLDAQLAKAIFSIGTVKGVEFGNGFKSATLKGSQNNDQIDKNGFITNNSGGIIGGISTGAEIFFRTACKATPSISQEQRSINIENKEEIIKIKGRHDPCVCPRVVPVIEAMSAITILDFILQQNKI